MSDWFSNRGQALQVVISSASLALAVAIAAKQQFIPIFWALITIPVGSLVIWRLARLPPKNDPSAPAQTAIAPSNGQSDYHESNVARMKPGAAWSVQKVTLKAGQRWIQDDGLTKKYQLRLLGIQKKAKGTLLAKVDLVWDLGRFFGGEQVLQTAPSEFAIPESKMSDPERLAAGLIFTPDLIRLFAVRVDHIDQHSNTVDFEVCIASGYFDPDERRKPLH